MSKIYVAKTTAFFRYEGKKVQIVQDRTTVEEGHGILEKYPHFFRELEPTYTNGYEEARQEPKPAKRGRPKKAETETTRRDPKDEVVPVEGRTYKTDKPKTTGLTTNSLEKNDDSGDAA